MEKKLIFKLMSHLNWVEYNKKVEDTPLELCGIFYSFDYGQYKLQEYSKQLFTELNYRWSSFHVDCLTVL